MLRSLTNLWPSLLLIGCTGTGPDIVPGSDDNEGVEEVTEDLINLSSQCTFVTGTGVATLALAAGDIALVAKSSTSTITINGYPCSTATSTTLKKLVVTGSVGAETLILDHMGGTFAPGLSGAVGVDIDLLGGTDAVKIRGSKLADTYVFGSTGATWNADAFKDIAFTGVETFVVTMSDGTDSFTGAGSVATGGAAFASDVTVYGGAGADTLRGGSGDDTLNGGDDADVFTTGTVTDGADIMNGGAGSDTADYSARTVALTITIDAVADDGEALETDTVAADVEVVKGGTNGDAITGSAAADILWGGPGDDTLTGGLGNDTLNGDAGNDIFNEGAATSGADIVNGGVGSDRVSYALRSNAVSVNLDAVALDGESGELDKVVNDVESVTGGGGADTLIGSTSDNILDGGAGIDTLSGGLGNDVLKGGLGADILNGDAGDDIFDEGAATSGADTLNGGAGIDIVNYAQRTVALIVTMDGVTGSGEAAEGDLIKTDVEVLVGGSAADSLTGNAADNQIEGGGAIDTINGLAGDDIIDGNVGADIIDCGAGDADLLLDTTVGSQVNCE